ncbi:MAG TPA: GHKL domain-containing protein [Sedimenticola sp.]|nr:GHKL domain-containing protein [Sedimenticola sp.]
MKFPLQRGRWNPTRITAISFLAMTLIVVVIGFLGTRHIVQYLEQRVIRHGIEHNQRILESVIPILKKTQSEKPDREGFIKAFRHQAKTGQSFGVHIFLVDGGTGKVVAGSLPVPYPGVPDNDLGALPMYGVDGEAIDDPTRWTGAAWVETPAGRVELLHLQPLPRDPGSGGPWNVGVVTDLGQLATFLDDLHWHLDTVLIVTYGLIALLGFLALRRFGRLYERKLEKTVAERTGELKRAHQEILDKTRLATIGQTASVLAHEMRNPLASLKFALSGIADSNCLAGRERKRVDLVLGEVDRLEQMLSDTLDYVRPVRMSEEAATLDELIDRVLQLEQPVIDRKQLRLDRTRCSRCPPLQVDQGQMQQVLLNLLKNAVEASPPGEQIDIHLALAAGSVELRIGNRGETLTRETLDKAFEPFFTTKPKGTGLGLGLVKRVVEEHGGRVGIDSDPGRGTQVTISLPTTE